MLDRMRRHRGWSSGSLALVVLAFIFLRPGLPRQLERRRRLLRRARLGRRDITAGEFQRIYRQQIDSYRRPTART